MREGGREGGRGREEKRERQTDREKLILTYFNVLCHDIVCY